MLTNTPFEAFNITATDSFYEYDKVYKMMLSTPYQTAPYNKVVSLLRYLKWVEPKMSPDILKCLLHHYTECPDYENLQRLDNRVSIDWMLSVSTTTKASAIQINNYQMTRELSIIKYSHLLISNCWQSTPGVFTITGASNLLTGREVSDQLNKLSKVAGVERGDIFTELLLSGTIKDEPKPANEKDEGYGGMAGDTPTPDEERTTEYDPV